MRRHQAGESIRAIGLAMNLDRRTVRSFVHADAFPERAQRAQAPSLLDAHRQYLEARTAEGCRNAMRLWRELRARGFTGGCSIVRDAVAQLRGALPEGSRPQAVAVAVGTAVREISPPLTRRACAWVLGWEKRKLSEDERSDRRRFVETLCRIEPAVAAARSLALRFMGLVRHHDLAGFDRWLPQARACAVPDLQRFAAGLKADLPAVRAAFSSPWTRSTHRSTAATASQSTSAGPGRRRPTFASRSSCRAASRTKAACSTPASRSSAFSPRPPASAIGSPCCWCSCRPRWRSSPSRCTPSSACWPSGARRPWCASPPCELVHAGGRPRAGGVAGRARRRRSVPPAKGAASRRLARPHEQRPGRRALPPLARRGAPVWSRYEPQWLRDRAAELGRWPGDADRWCVFDNTAAGHAISNALELWALLQDGDREPAA